MPQTGLVVIHSNPSTAHWKDLFILFAVMLFEKTKINEKEAVKMDYETVLVLSEETHIRKVLGSNPSTAYWMDLFLRLFEKAKINKKRPLKCTM